MGGGEEKKGEEERIGQWVSSSSLSVETMPSPPRGGGSDLANMVAAAEAACHAEEKKGGYSLHEKELWSRPALELAPGHKGSGGKRKLEDHRSFRTKN